MSVLPTRVCNCRLANVASEMAKPVPAAVPPRIGRVGEQPDERDNEIVIELDRENQYSRTQPRANEPQGNEITKQKRKKKQQRPQKNNRKSSNYEKMTINSKKKKRQQINSHDPWPFHEQLRFILSIFTKDKNLRRRSFIKWRKCVIYYPMEFPPNFTQKLLKKCWSSKQIIVHGKWNSFS